jgi:hypothetical protein
MNKHERKQVRTLAKTWSLLDQQRAYVKYSVWLTLEIENGRHTVVEALGMTADEVRRVIEKDYSR